MEVIFNEIFRAVGYLVISCIVYTAWNIARESVNGDNVKTILWKGFLWCAGIALITSISLGAPSCIDEEYDPHGSVCNEYADDGFEPTTEQRAANFAYFMTLLYIPVLVGAYKGKNSHRTVNI